MNGVPTRSQGPQLSWRQRLADPLAFYLSRCELRRLMASNEPEALVDATSAYQGRGVYARIPAVQRRSEILGLVQRVRDLSPKVVVEIGTYV
jgi:hypothetical protein